MVCFSMYLSMHASVCRCVCICHPLAEVKEQSFEDEHGPGAAQDGQRLTREQTEDGTS